MALKEFERAFCQYIFSDAGAEAVTPLLRHYSSEEREARLSIYKNNVFASLISVMSDRYPAVVRVVGDNFFKACARVYLAQYPPKVATMIELGEEFPAFLESFAPAATLPYLPDVARLDLACHIAYHAADAAPLGADEFARVDPGELASCRIDIHPSAVLVNSRYACFSIWNFSVEEHSNAKDINADEPENVLIVRPHMEVNTYSLTPGSYAFIDSLLAGDVLGEALHVGITQDSAFSPAEAVQFLIQSGLATKITGEPGQ